MTDLYTNKQLEIFKFMKTKDPFITILHGAKRAGKTVANNDLFLMELRRVREVAKKQGIDKPQYILAGNSLGTLQRNVLIELSNKYDIEFKFDKFNRFELFGVLVCCFGHGTISDLGRIRGMTAHGAYINEGSTARNEVFKEILNRCSGEGARVLVDTNPDNPLHWLKTDYIDKADFETIAEFQFTLFDNDFLTKRYINNIVKATPSGVFTDRDIYGRWVSAEGVVYKDFNKDIHIVKEIPSDEIVERYIGGVDWGFEHHGSIVVLAKTKKGNYYLVEEIAEQHKYIDWWKDRMVEIKDKYKSITFHCDSARSEYVDYVKKFVTAKNANKSVIEGIDFVGSLLKQNKLFFLEEKFKKGLKEMYLYCWNPKAAGKDEVLKVNDDVMDSLRYSLMSEFNKRVVKVVDINDVL